MISYGPPTQTIRDFNSFGGNGDGVTDNASAFAQAISWLSVAADRVIMVPAGTYATSSTITIGNGKQRSTTLSSGLAGGETAIPVASITGIADGDTIVVVLDNGETATKTVTGTPSAGSVPINGTFSGVATAGNAVYTGKVSSWHGGQLIGFGSGATEITGAPAVSTIKYIGAAAPTTTLGATAAAGATSITVASISNINLHDPIGITLDTGTVWWTQVRETPTGTTVKLTNEVPSQALNGNAVKIANVPVVRVLGPVVGAVVRDILLDANSLASTGLETLSPRRCLFRNVVAKGYTGVGFYMQSSAAQFASGGGTVDTEFELYALAPENNRTIGGWIIGNAGPSGNNNTNVAFSRNRFIGGTFTMGGADTFAAALRLEYADNNRFIGIYTAYNGANQSGAGLYRMPSFYRTALPLENTHIGPAYLGGIVNGTATGAVVGEDYVTAFSTSDQEPVPTSGINGSTYDGQYFGVRQLTSGQMTPALLLASSFTTGSNLTRSVVTSGRYAYVISSVTAGNVLVHVIDISDPSAMVEVSETDIGAGNANGKVVLAGGYLFIPINDGTNSLRIVDVTNPATPAAVSVISTANAGVRALAVSGNILFVGTVTGGVFRAYDISNPALPVQLSTMSLSTVTRITSIALQGKYAYVGQLTTTDKGLEIIDVSNPYSMSSVGSYDANADVHALAVSGRYAYLSLSTGVLDVVNISNPAAPASVGTLTLTSATSSSSSGFLAAAGNYLYVGGSTSASGIQIVDISNPLIPTLAASGITINTTNIDSALSGNTLFVVTTGTTLNLRAYKISGANLATAQIGALYTDQVRVGGNAIFDKQIIAEGGIVSGLQGIFSRGVLSAFGGYQPIQAVSPRLCHSGNRPVFAAADGTDTTPVVTETYIAEVYVPVNMTVTGVAILNGTAVAGNIGVAIANSSGTVLASTSAAGVAASGTAAFQRVPFSAAARIKGPGTYYILLQSNNTAYRFRSHPVVADFGASKKTGETFGTWTTITPPTTFTAGQGPIASLY